MYHKQAEDAAQGDGPISARTPHAAHNDGSQDISPRQQPIHARALKGE